MRGIFFTAELLLKFSCTVIAEKLRGNVMSWVDFISNFLMVDLVENVSEGVLRVSLNSENIRNL